MFGQDIKAGKLRILHTEKEKRGPYSFRDFKCHIHAGKISDIYLLSTLTFLLRSRVLHVVSTLKPYTWMTKGNLKHKMSKN